MISSVDTFSDYHWYDPYLVIHDPCAGGDPRCCRDSDGRDPSAGGNGSGGFCSHDRDVGDQIRESTGSRLSKN